MFIAVALVAIAILFRLLLLATAAVPFILLGGWLWTQWTTARRASGLKGDLSDFWLTSPEKQAFWQASAQMVDATERLDALEAEADRRGLSRNMDGTVSRRSNVGKELAAAEVRAEEALQAYKVLEVLPLARWSELNKSYRRRNGFLFGAITWMGVATLLPVGYGQEPLVASLESFWNLLNTILSDHVDFGSTEAHTTFLWLAPICSIAAFFLGRQFPSEPAAKVSPKPELVTVENVDSTEPLNAEHPAATHTKEERDPLSHKAEEIQRMQDTLVEWTSSAPAISRSDLEVVLHAYSTLFALDPEHPTERLLLASASWAPWASELQEQSLKQGLATAKLVIRDLRSAHNAAASGREFTLPASILGILQTLTTLNQAQGDRFLDHLGYIMGDHTTASRSGLDALLEQEASNGREPIAQFLALMFRTAVLSDRSADSEDRTQ